MKKILDVIHKTICQFFDKYDGEKPISDKDKLLLEVNKAITNNLKALEQEPKKGRTIDADELLKRISEKAKTPSLSEDTVNGLCGATAIIYDMLNESGKEND